MVILLMAQSIWAYFRNLTWNDALTMTAVLAAIASTVVPYLDNGQFRSILFIFIAVSSKLQALQTTQENKKLRVMIGDLSDSVQSAASTPAAPALPASTLPAK